MFPHPLRSGVGKLVACLAIVAAGCAATLPAATMPAAAASATPSDPPTVTSLSRHTGPYWGATWLTIRGTNFTGATQVLFGTVPGYALTVVSPTRLTVLTPEHGYRAVDVRVVTPSGTSPRTAADAFRFVRPTMNTPIMGGLTARQEQAISRRVRAAHRHVWTAPARRYWTVAMGATALRRARSWLGLPYSWVGGNLDGPTVGVCAHNGGDLDCHVAGFDCSGLALYAWSPYRHLDHYAATQHWQAGRFHPSIGELMPGDLVFFSGYIANGIGHVAVYAGHGMVVQAAQSGTLVMRSRLVDVIAESGRYRGATRPMTTGRQRSVVPRVGSVTAQLPVGGGTVVVTGSHLDAATAVTIGSTTIYSFVQKTPTRLVLRAPAHAAGRVTVTVATAWRTARGVVSYVAAPTLAALSPATGPTAGGTTVTLTGHSLGTVRSVTLGGSAVAFETVSDSTLRFTTPAHAAGPVALTVRSPFGSSNAVTFAFADAGGAPGVPTTSAPERVSHARVPALPLRVPTSGQVLLDRIGDGWYLLNRGR